jgi:periplasmic protein TonB
MIRLDDGRHRWTAALLIAALLHLPLLSFLSRLKLPDPEPLKASPRIFELEVSPKRALPRKAMADPVASPPPKPTVKAMPLRESERPGAGVGGQKAEALPPQPKVPEVKPVLPSRPDFSAGLLAQQISEVSESLVRKKNAAVQGKRIVYATEARGHTATLSAYEEAWQAKVEHIGNLNYPEAARDQGISGTLTVAVAINPDGSLFSVRILRSSGNPLLDEGATRIVHLSAPFAPLPLELLSDIDILVITRTWRFDDQAHFSSK